MTFYLGIFPTPGGDKHHLFSLTEQGGTITNSMGPVALENFTQTAEGFSCDMPADPGKHHFEAVRTDSGIHVTGTVIMEGRSVGAYEADMERKDSDFLPADPDGPAMPPPERGEGGTTA